MPGVENSQRFPFVNLEKALERAKAIYTADQRGNAMPVLTAFEVWGYSPKSSGGFQTVAALKMYGLMLDLGANEDRKVQLSPQCLHYFRDERPEEQAKLLQSFAVAPPLLRTLWNKWGGSPPDDVVARSQLKIELKLNEQSARTALGIYKENLAFAKLTGGAKVVLPESAKGEEIDTTPKAKIGDFVQWTSNGVDQFKPARKVVWVADDGSHVRVHGSPTGIPMAEVTVVDEPKPFVAQPPSGGAEPGRTPSGSPDINVYLTGGRLQINADVDADGLERLKTVLAKYGEILKLLQ